MRSRRPVLAIVLAFLLASCASAPPPSTAAAPTTTFEAEADFDLEDVDSLADVARLDWPEPQRVLRSFSRARETVWGQIYGDGGTEVYCRKEFTGTQASNRRIGRRTMDVEHAMPAKFIANRYGCDGRNCDDEEYKYAESDLHNLWPAYSSINRSRGDSPFNEIEGEEENRRFIEFCPDYERISEPETVEPDDEARGDLARSILYMHHVYGVPLDAVAPSPKVLVQWHKSDPSDSEEREREATIRGIQGTWNPLVMPKGPGM